MGKRTAKKEAVSKEDILETVLDQKQKRRKIRYWLFRFHTESNGGSKATKSPTGLRAKFEDQAAFTLAGGWPTFGVKWDVDQSGLGIVALDMSLASKWDAHLELTAKELPSADLRPSDEDHHGDHGSD